MKNFNWGHGIALFYIVFVGVLLTALISSFGVDHSLVVEDYYAKDLNYQKQYEKMQNANANHNALIKNNLSEKTISVEFLEGTPSSASAQFYRPSDASKDFSIAFDKSINIISTETMVKGKWVIKLEWNENGKKFYLEQDIII